MKTYLFVWNTENALELYAAVKHRKSIDLIRYEVNLVLLAHFHQSDSHYFGVNHTKWVVRVAKYEALYSPPKLSLLENLLLQQLCG